MILFFLFFQDRKLKEKNQTFDKNVEKRGSVPNSLTVINCLKQKKEDKFPVGPVLLGFFLFVVVGSALFQILNTATSAGGNSVY